MPRCEIEKCDKKDLGPGEVVYHRGSNRIVCVPCSKALTNVVSLVPTIPLPDGEEIAYDFSVSSEKGVSADIRAGKSSMHLEAAPEDLKSVLKKE